MAKSPNTSKPGRPPRPPARAPKEKEPAAPQAELAEQAAQATAPTQAQASAPPPANGFDEESHRRGRCRTATAVGR